MVISFDANMNTLHHFVKRLTILQVVTSCFVLLVLVQVIQFRTENQLQVSNASKEITITPETGLQRKDLCLTVMTGANTHWRLDSIIKTWFQHASDVTYFFSDSQDPDIESRTNNHFISLNCTKGYEAKTGNCKVGHMYDFFTMDDRCMRSKWWCKFDDDNYVNVKNLIKVIRIMPQ